MSGLNSLGTSTKPSHLQAPKLDAARQQPDKSFSALVKEKPMIARNKSINSLSKSYVSGIKGSEGRSVPEYKQGVNYPSEMTGSGLALKRGYGSYIPNASLLEPHEAGTVVCNGKGGFKAIVNPLEGDKCGISQCTEAHENLHVKQFNKHEPNLCKHPQGIDGAAIAYLDLETTKFYERPAYELTVACLEDKKKEFSLFDRVFTQGCVEKINKYIDYKKYRYKSETGEPL